MTLKLSVVFFITLFPLADMHSLDATYYVDYPLPTSDGSNQSDASRSLVEYYVDWEFDERLTDATKWVIQGLIPILGLLGVCGNVVVLVVWSAETAFNPTTFLIKCLAVSDILLLVSQNLILIGFVYHLSLFFRTVTVHTTLGVVVTRWVAVNKPLKVQILLTKRRVVVGFVLMLMWCLGAPVARMLLSVGGIVKVSILAPLNIVEVVYLALPITVLVVLNTSLLYTLCSRAHSPLLGQQQHAARAARSSQLHHMVKAVLCLSVSTVLAYPVAVTFRIFLDIRHDYFYHLCPYITCYSLMYAASFLLELTNSSINVIFYAIFASRFRQLCRRRCGRKRKAERAPALQQMTVQHDVWK